MGMIRRQWRRADKAERPRNSCRVQGCGYPCSFERPVCKRCFEQIPQDLRMATYRGGEQEWFNALFAIDPGLRAQVREQIEAQRALLDAPEEIATLPQAAAPGAEAEG